MKSCKNEFLTKCEIYFSSFQSDIAVVSASDSDSRRRRRIEGQQQGSARPQREIGVGGGGFLLPISNHREEVYKSSVSGECISSFFFSFLFVKHLPRKHNLTTCHYMRTVRRRQINSNNFFVINPSRPLMNPFRLAAVKKKWQEAELTKEKKVVFHVYLLTADHNIIRTNGKHM